MRLPLATAARSGEANERVQLDHVWGDAVLVVVEVPKAGPSCRLRTYAYFADRDQLSGVVLERMLAGVSTRRYRRTKGPLGSEVEASARSTSRVGCTNSAAYRIRPICGEIE
jgi:hypothetical protein